MPKMKPKEYALYLLKFRDRAEAEIRDRMSKKGYDVADIEEAVVFLKSKKFLDDERFAKNYVKNKMVYGLKGKYKVRSKLLRLGIDEDIVKRALQSITKSQQKDLLHELAEKYIRKRSLDLADYKDRSKLMRYLASRGFSYDIVKEILDEHEQ